MQGMLKLSGLIDGFSELLGRGLKWLILVTVTISA